MSLIEDRNTQKLRALRSLVVECPELRELEKRLGRFNIFDVLKSAHNEIRHSNVLAWLLDPEGSHGLNELFLRRWLMRVFHDTEGVGANYLDPVEIDSAPFRSVEVRREWGRIDLLVEIVTLAGQHWIICIENKTWSWQRTGQLAGYRAQVERAFPRSARQVYIFLTVRAEEPEDAPYVIGTYDQVSSVLDTCLAEHASSIGEAPRTMLEHYLAILRERFMDSSEVIRLARQIYKKHRLALDTIFDHRPDSLLLATEELDQRVKADAETLAIKHKYAGKGWIGFVPSSWEVPENKISDSWSTVLCEVKLTGDRLRVKAFVNPSAPENWRKRLYDLAQQHSFPITSKRSKMPEGRFSFYRVRGNELGMEEIEESEIGEKFQEIWSWVKGIILSDEFKSMATVVAEHLKDLSTYRLYQNVEDSYERLAVDLKAKDPNAQRFFAFFGNEINMLRAKQNLPLIRADGDFESLSEP